MKLRRFNNAGMVHFRDALAKLRENPNGEVPHQLLEDDAFSRQISPAIIVDHRHFASRRDAAEYFRELLTPLDEAETAFDAELWTWLTLFYFDEVCPVKSGKRTVRNDYHYIYEPRNQRHVYRHLLSLGWRVLYAAPKHNRLMLDVPLAVLDKATVEIMKRLYLVRIPCIFEVVDRIYWDAGRCRIRSGMVNPSARLAAGDLTNRFHMRIRQLEATYDLQSLSADQLITLLGDEFAAAKSTTALAS